jgi:hypothetical protein
MTEPENEIPKVIINPTEEERAQIINDWLAWLPTVEDEAACLKWMAGDE